MIKSLELSSPSSCLSRAGDDELLFVLLGRDLAAPAAIRAWIEERIRLNKNQRDDDQIKEAATCARQMQVQQAQPISLTIHIALAWTCKLCGRKGKLSLPIEANVAETIRMVAVSHRSVVTENRGYCTDELMFSIVLDTPKPL